VSPAASAPPYLVAAADLAGDREVVCGIINRNPSAAAVAVAAARLAWLFDRNPAGPGRTWLLKAREGLTPVGTGSVVLRRMSIRGSIGLAGRASLLAVDPAHRTLGPALLLERQLAAFAGEARLSAVFAVAPPATVPVFERCGYVRLGDYLRYAKPIDLTPHVTRLTGVRAGARVIAAPANAALRLVSRDSWAGTGGGVIAPVTAFDARFDELWNRAAANWGFTTARTSSFLAWRFADAPSAGDYTTLALMSRDEREVRAYAVVLIQGDHVHVHDLFAPSPGPDFERMLAGVVRWARAARVNSVSLSISADAAADASVRRVGFRPRADAEKASSLLVLCPDPLVLERIRREGWYILPADNV